MQRLIFRSLVPALAVVLLAGAACGPNPGGRPPVSSPVYQFQAPDAEDFETEDEDDDTVPPDDVDPDAGGAE